jgi:chitin synthase
LVIYPLPRLKIIIKILFVNKNITVVFPGLICPKQDIFTLQELQLHDGGTDHTQSDAYVAIRGVVYDLTQFLGAHYPSIIPQKSMLNYAGRDATNLFPVQVSALCPGKSGDGVANAILLDYKGTNATQDRSLDPNAKYHDFRYFTDDFRPDWFYEQMMVMRINYLKGNIGYSKQDVARAADKENRNMAIIGNRVYDMTDYLISPPRIEYPPSVKNPDYNIDPFFMDSMVADLFRGRSGQDITKYWETLRINKDVKTRMKLCLDRLFFIGKVDTRNSPQCQFARYLLLAISVLLVSVIAFKFFAALQFTKKNMPENLDKFIMCQVPAYTEDEESLRRAMDSIARMRYDDKRKLLIVVCDGMIIGQGNDRSTPRIVLDILGVPESVDPEPLSFESLGEGQKQHNMGKVYSGLYEVQGHIVPFLVVVKVGKPSEVSRPGNRGKRDSQMVIMRFLNRVHYNDPMSPLELEMHHQIRNIIGVNPTFYEFILQVDAGECGGF